MPEDLAESVSEAVELVFPDDAPGREYRLQERTVYDAAEVRDEADMDEVPQYGRWLPVKVDGSEAWLNAPSELRHRLVEAKVGVGDRFTIDRLTKSGHRESDPYRAEITVTGDGTGQADIRAATDDD